MRFRKAVRSRCHWLGVLFLAFASVIWAEEGSKKGLFWKAESSAGTAYLLGAIHFGDDDFYPLRSKIMSAYQDSPVLMVEMDDQAVPLEEQQKIMMETVTFPQGETLEQHVNSKTMSVIKKRLDEFGVPLQAVQHYRPGFVALMLASLQAIQLGYIPEKGIDFHFMRLARGNKPILQIESFRQQMEFISKLPEDDDAIRESFEQMDDYQKMWTEMEDAWIKGDADRMYRIAIADPLKEAPESAPVYDILFYQRNGPMADSVQQCVKEHKTCFVVVGAGHLVGARSVIEALEKKGFNVSQL
ncbi:TraB/GumN family protein [Hahella sp. CCB-MM4]|uniref:TraB/GumN family protein n=1 Tax=Hahella sp. (strain CCB-MM4) TaxID=1926491 RepID=UPI000B9B754B|nr:TraB/GumN family protein [Hahella sp. CCB-MM4]OZG70595.1 TraB/GumN family protein [Hahella sp. CCB-MM4]